MKTAEEWLSDIEIRRIASDSDYLRIIKEIQLDSYRAGGLVAAELGYMAATRNANAQSHSLGTQLLFSTAGIFKKSILTHFNQLTKLPK